MSSMAARRIDIDKLRSTEIKQVCRLLLRVALSLDDLLRIDYGARKLYELALGE